MEAHWVPPGGLSPELAQSCSEGSYFHNGFGVEGSASQAAYALYWLQNPSQGPEPEVAAAAALELIASMEAQARPCDDVETLSEMERRYVTEVLQRCQGNLSEAARALGIGRTTLYRKIEKYGLKSGCS